MFGSTWGFAEVLVSTVQVDPFSLCTQISVMVQDDKEARMKIILKVFMRFLLGFLYIEHIFSVQFLNVLLGSFNRMDRTIEKLKYWIIYDK